MKLGPESNQTQFTIDFKQYLDALYSYAVVLSRNRTEAEDLVQETCLRALRAAQRLRPDSNIKSWLFTILRNIWLNQVRQSRTTPEVGHTDLSENSASNIVDGGRDPYAIYASTVERERVEEAIQQLPLEFLEVILLREYEELSYEEIATLLNCPLGTVMSRLARARSRLRDLLLVASRSQRKSALDGEETPAWDPAGNG